MMGQMQLKVQFGCYKIGTVEKVEVEVKNVKVNSNAINHEYKIRKTMIGKTVNYKTDRYDDNRTDYRTGEILDKNTYQDTDYYLIKRDNGEVDKVECSLITRIHKSNNDYTPVLIKQDDDGHTYIIPIYANPLWDNLFDAMVDSDYNDNKVDEFEKHFRAYEVDNLEAKQLYIKNE